MSDDKLYKSCLLKTQVNWENITDIHFVFCRNDKKEEIKGHDNSRRCYCRMYIIYHHLLVLQVMSYYLRFSVNSKHRPICSGFRIRIDLQKQSSTGPHLLVWEHIYLFPSQWSGVSSSQMIFELSIRGFWSENMDSDFSSIME